MGVCDDVHNDPTGRCRDGHREPPGGPPGGSAASPYGLPRDGFLRSVSRSRGNVVFLNVPDLTKEGPPRGLYEDMRQTVAEVPF